MSQVFLLILQLLLLATVGAPVAYLFVLSVLAAVARSSANVEPTSSRRFAVVIPAHNEESTIAPTIQSVFRMAYPRTLFDVFVIADNCSDQTAAVSREQGARVLEREDDSRRGKGYALRWCFDRLLSSPEAYDALVVVDADSTLSANFLGIMNSYLNRGFRVLQSSDLVRPQPGAWSSEMTRLGFTLYNYVRPLGRRVLGCSPGLRGNGMCFAADVLRSFPWEAYSRAEDLEFGLHLLLNGVPAAFAPEAVVLATMPRDPKLAESQRARWEGGRVPVIRKYAPKLLRRGILRVSFTSLDALIDLLTPALINLIALVLGILALTAILYVAGAGPALLFVQVWMGVLILGFLHMLLGLYAAHADKALYRTLFHLPRYTLWKLLLYLRLARQGKTDEWVRTTREPVVARGKSGGGQFPGGTAQHLHP